MVGVGVARVALSESLSILTSKTTTSSSCGLNGSVLRLMRVGRIPLECHESTPPPPPPPPPPPSGGWLDDEDQRNGANVGAKSGADKNDNAAPVASSDTSEITDKFAQLRQRCQQSIEIHHSRSKMEQDDESQDEASDEEDDGPLKRSKKKKTKCGEAGNPEVGRSLHATP